MKTTEEIIRDRIVYIGDELPGSLLTDKRPKFVLLGNPEDLIKELSDEKKVL